MVNEEKPLRIVELRVDNFKRLRAIHIRPNGSTVIIGGRNAQGKSSALDAIEVALGGAKSTPLEPIRRGARKARSFLDLGELTVECTFTPRGRELIVREKGDPVPKKSPQAILDKLCAKVAFDPLEFARMEPKKQDELLKKLLGLDFSDLERERQCYYEERTEANRELARLDALLNQAPYHPGAPKEAVSVSALTAELETRREAVAARARAVHEWEWSQRELAERDKRITVLEGELEELRAERTAMSSEIDAAKERLPPEVLPPTDIQERLRTAEETNAKVRANLEHDKLEKGAQVKANESEECSAKIAELDQKKAERLGVAKFPIDGLGFDDSGPTFGGVPLSQASQAERLRVSVAIGAALNPRLKVMLVREGSLLDQDSLAMLEELADKTGSQIWIERVSDKDPGAVIIEDGSVVNASDEEVDNAGADAASAAG